MRTKSEGRAQPSPQFVPPMLPTRIRELPTKPGWSFELKFDGYRIEAIKDGESVRLFSRRGNDFTKRFARIAQAVSKVRAASAVIDGEVVVADEEGRPSFQMLQTQAKLPGGWGVVYYAFDLLHLDGKDLKHLPLSERRVRLEELLRGSPVRFSAALDGPPEVVIKAVSEYGMEGVMAKRVDSVYKPGERSEAWCKLLLKNKGEFVIGGYRLDEGRLDLLVVGYYEKGELLFAGQFRGGLTPAIRSTLLKGLQTIRTETCPFANLPQRKKGAFDEGITAPDMGQYVWLEPCVVVDLKFTQWTTSGMLRNPEFVAIRDDKDPAEVEREG